MVEGLFNSIRHLILRMEEEIGNHCRISFNVVDGQLMIKTLWITFKWGYHLRLSTEELESALYDELVYQRIVNRIMEAYNKKKEELNK
jgi:hypothetical protein